MTSEDHAAYRQLNEIMHASFDPLDAIADTRRLLDKGPAAATYWDEVPGKVTRLPGDADKPDRG